MKPYTFLPHTADIGITVRGNSLEDLFSNCAFSLFDIIADLDQVENSEQFNINIKSANTEELLHDWLKELLFQCNTTQIVFKEFKIAKLTEKEIESIALGQKVKSRDVLKTEIKAITYHDLSIKQEGNIYKASLVFDV